MTEIELGSQLRINEFLFDPSYRPLNHGSYGAFPKVVRAKQRELQDKTEGRSDPFIRFTVPKILRESRAAVAPLLGASMKEVVFIPNATTGINTVLRNLEYKAGDVILYLSTAYRACEKTILHVCETTAAESVKIDVSFPIEDEDFISLFDETVRQLHGQGKKVRIAMFDTVATFPGVRLPWQRLTATCRGLNVLSLVDGAHGIGHIDLTKVHEVDPDFFISNCYK
jgi:hercynylcysteine S-oxide lyase